MLDSDPRVPFAALQRFGTAAMQAIGCDAAIAAEISDHLVDADLCGVYSHGIFRLDWYAEQRLYVLGLMKKYIQCEMMKILKLYPRDCMKNYWLWRRQSK